MKVILSGDFGDGGRPFLQKLDHVALELTAESATRLIPKTRLRQHRFPPIFDGNLFSLFGGDAQDGTDRAVTVAVRLCTLNEVGHAWSGGDPKFKFHSKKGPSAAVLIWGFFAKHFR